VVNQVQESAVLLPEMTCMLLLLKL